MENIFTNIKAYLYERVTNPFGVVFIFSWAIWNFRLMLVIFSSENVVTKISFMDQHFQTANPLIASYGWDFHGYLFNSFCAPLSLACIYIFVSPILSIPVYKFSLKVRAVMVNSKKKAEGLELMTNEDARSLRVRVSQMKSSYERQLDELNLQNEALTEELNNKQRQVHATVSENSNNELPPSFWEKEIDDETSNEKIKGFVDNDIEPIHEEVMNLFANNTEELHESGILARLKPQNHHIIKSALEDLLDWNWLRYDGYNGDYSVLPEGRKYIVNMLRENNTKNRSLNNT